VSRNRHERNGRMSEERESMMMATCDTLRKWRAKTVIISRWRRHFPDG
jgi:hypothetical protein